ncbi:MAG: helix-turn-helix domain-containing protein [Prochloron sp. SP5CPC1]|nr:helix-turn-helix domain-containing protein [Candidatus Paraprochloron terpiosi SP5CPC1]
MVGSKFQTPGNPEQAVGVQEAAYLLGVCPQRVRQLLGQGRIAGASKVAGRWRIPLGASGLPHIFPGTRGPQGTWCRPPSGKTIILINSKQIRANIASNSPLPVIDIICDGTVHHCHGVAIRGPSRILYRPHGGGDHSLWIEVSPGVEVVPQFFAANG